MVLIIKYIFCLSLTSQLLVILKMILADTSDYPRFSLSLMLVIFSILCVINILTASVFSEGLAWLIASVDVMVTVVLIFLGRFILFDN